MLTTTALPPLRQPKRIPLCPDPTTLESANHNLFPKTKKMDLTAPPNRRTPQPDTPPPTPQKGREKPSFQLTNLHERKIKAEENAHLESYGRATCEEVKWGWVVEEKEKEVRENGKREQ